MSPLEVRALLASFQGLGANTTAAAVSADGSVVVGNVKNQGPFYWTQGSGVVLLRDSSGNIYPGPLQSNRRFRRWVRHRGRQPGYRLGDAFRWANGVAAPIPQLAGTAVNSIANSVSTDGTIIAGDIP